MVLLLVLLLKRRLMLGPPVSATIAVATTATAVDTKTTAYYCYNYCLQKTATASATNVSTVNQTLHRWGQVVQPSNWTTFIHARLKKTGETKRGAQFSTSHVGMFGPQTKCTSDFSHHQLSLFLPPAGQNASKSSIINCLA